MPEFSPVKNSGSYAVWLCAGLLVIAAGAMVGCSPPAEQAAKTEGPKPPANEVVQKPASETPTKQPDKKPNGEQNAKRIYQLADLAKGKITIDGRSIEVWIMDSDSKREEGMMWLEDKDVKADQGMLFVFPKPGPLSFWMQNTVLPLDIMYISASGKMLNIVKGKPFDETSLPSKGEAQFVLEMKQGSAARLGYKAGSKVVIPPELKKAQ